jgi:DNA repair protein RecN (Recombination protein N)
LFCANPGSGFFPLKKIASGGERSRIMLAIKAILARFKKLPTIIFDEIDTGVSGKVSDQIASIMAELANHMQVFAITHLPQVAAKGAQHLKVLKETDGEITQTFLKQLDAKERELEIAQMLSGTETGLTAVAHAKELLK